MATRKEANRLRSDPVVSVVIVNHDAWADVARIVDVLGASAEVAAGDCEVIVVDNASRDSMPEALQSCRAGVIVHLSDDNGGFAAGVNTGRRLARGRWVLLLNPDVVVVPDFLNQVLTRIRHHEQSTRIPGIVGFGLRNADGTIQPSVGAEPGILRLIVEAFLPRSRRKYKAVWAVKPGPVPWVTGACMLVDAGLLSGLGGMDEDFFLYYEEVALCRAVRSAGREVVFDPEVSVVHLRPLQNRPITPGMRVVTRHSRSVFFQKYGTRAQSRAIGALTRAEALVRGQIARITGDAAEQRAWRLVAQVTDALAAGRRMRGSDVRDLASGISKGRGGHLANDGKPRAAVSKDAPTRTAL